MINFFVDNKAFIIKEDDITKVENILKRFKVDFDIRKDCAKVTLIGAEIMGTPGVMARVVTSLSKYNIQLLQTSDSHMTISCLVKKDDMLNAVHAIHDEFNG